MRFEPETFAFLEMCLTDVCKHYILISISPSFVKTKSQAYLLLGFEPTTFAILKQSLILAAGTLLIDEQFASGIKNSNSGFTQH